MHKEYKIITLQDIGGDPKKTQVCVVVEELKNRLIRYLKFDCVGDKNGENKYFKFSQLGVMFTESKKSSSPSPLLKYRAVCRLHT